MSSQTLDAAFNGLQPDMKVLEFEKQQPEFKTPIWDYVDGLVDEERVADGKTAMAQNAHELARAEQTYGVSRYMLAAIWGVEFEFRHGDGQPAAGAVAVDARLLWRAARLFPLRADGDAEDHRPRRHSGRQARRLLGGRVRADPVHALELSAPRGRRERRRPRHRRFRRRRARLDRQLLRQIRAGAPGVPWGFEVKLPPGYSGPSGRKAKAADVLLGGARDRPRIDGRPLGEGDAGLLLPAGSDGPAFLVTHNFDVVYSYNAAESYSLAACVLADRLAGGPGIVTPWPTDDPGLSRAGRRELQTLLARQGYDVGQPDGAIGAKTKAAIADFEQKQGMPVNGRASSKVLEALRR